jgi:hypothetical protein
MKDEIKSKAHGTYSLRSGLFSSFILHPSSFAFTLIEMLTTFAALVILLGLMVSLARDVRARSANALTGEILGRLERLMAEYQQQTGALPAVVSILADEDAGGAKRPSVDELARLNNRQFVAALRSRFPLDQRFADLQAEGFNEPGVPDSASIERGAGPSPARSSGRGRPGSTAINDAWGDPIVFMPHSDPSIGLSPDNRFFFFSAGPDRQYLTRDDNLYSYDRDSGGQSE